MKYNPFMPSGFVTPGMFHGRVAEMKAIERALFQARHGNPVHFLIMGERGIGKSSLLHVAALVASGKLPTIEDQHTLRFLVVQADLGNAKTQLDIVRAIASQLRREVSKKEALKHKAKAFWEWVSNWEVLGVRYHKDNANADPQDAIDELVSRLSDLCVATDGELDGIAIFIDEADHPPEEAALGAFSKFFTERLAREGCSKVILGLAGLPTLLPKLRASHESAPRVFSTLLLDPLEPHERNQVVESGLDEAASRNDRATEIEDDALRLISNLSEGYPHFIQQFAFSAFDTDQDDNIDREDVLDGAFAENGALSQLGDKFFSEMYHSKIASNDYRRVLNTMAEVGDAWIGRKEIIERSGLLPTTVTNALNTLKAKAIIQADESRKGRGFYRLPTRSFAAWILAVKAVTPKGREPFEHSHPAANEG